MITEDGVARLADFGISSLATNPSIDNSGSMSVHNRKVCYMAPEQLEPSTFNRESANATKESDVHSFAMTAYEVRSPASFIRTAERFASPLGPHGESAIRRREKLQSNHQPHFRGRPPASATAGERGPVVT